MMSTPRVDAAVPRTEAPPAEAESARSGGAATPAGAGARAAGAERGSRARATPGAKAPPGAGSAGSARARALERARATARAARPAAPAAPPPKGYAAAATSSSGEWAFLDAKGTSIEDKLFLFMKKVMEKTDKELVDKMKEYKARFTAAKPASASSQKKGTSLFDVAKVVVPALGMAEKLLGEAGMKKLVSSLGGPVLAAAATAAGLPQLAPLALRYGGDVAALAFKDVGGSAAAPSSSAASAAEPGSPDEKLAMLEIQVLVEKQQRMFAAVSGTLKAMHDAEMVAVHNIR
jgi:hypothetical protein